MKKIFATLLILIPIILLLTACSPQSETAEPLPVESQPARLIVEGRLLPLNSLDHSFSTAGQVSEVLVTEGQTVTAGEVIARLSPTPESLSALRRAQQEVLAAQQAVDGLYTNADLALAQAKLAVVTAQELVDTAQEEYDLDETDENLFRLEAAQANFSLAEKKLAMLESNNGVDPDVLAAYQARLNSANAAETSAMALMDAHELKAAVDGVIVGLNLQTGQHILPNQNVLTIVDFSQWIVKTDNLTEIDVVNISVGDQVEIVLDALPSITFAGEVSQISARFEEKRGDVTYTVTIQMIDSDPQMRWGMTAAVAFSQ